MTTKEKLMECRRACAERGAKFIEVTHLDGRKSRIENPEAVKAALDALKVELDRQIEELGGDEARSGMNEVVRDWMLREHADERKFMEDFSEGQKKKVLIAASLITPAHLYIWDEPLNFIDVFSRMQIEKLIRDFQPTMLLVEHDVRFREQVDAEVVEIRGL